MRSRRVSVRPAPDGMAYLSVLGPLKDVVGAHAAVQARSRSVVGGQCPEEGPEGRGVGAVAADTALRLLSGRAIGQPQPVERAPGDDRPGPARHRRPRPVGVRAGPAPRPRQCAGPGGPGLAARRPGGPSRSPATAHCGRCLTGRPGLTQPWATRHGAGTLPAAARVWVRRLYTTPDGRDLVAMDSRRRVFGGMLRRMLVLRDDVCTTSWCEAPIVHADHATPVRQHGETSFVEGNGKCARCNHVKEAPGWRTRVVLTGAGHRGGEDTSRARRVVQVTTPLGHSYAAEPPPLLGWGSQTLPVVRAPRTSPGTPPATVDDGPVAPSQTSARGASAGVGSAPVAPSPTRPAAAEAPGWPRQPRKRALRRARTLSGTSTVARSRPERRPRLTSHLERRLCRYLT